MTIYFKNHEIQIYRKRRVGSSNRFTISATFTAFSADIQPATRERIEMFGGRFGAMFTAFVDVSIDVRENDQVVTEDGKKYSVKGVQVWAGAGLLDHKELVLIAQDAY